MTDQNMKKLYALLMITLICVIASLGIGIYSLTKVNRTCEVLEKKYSEITGITTEDNVVIADEYEIKPTKDISDAYKSGDQSKLDDKQKETLDMARAVLDKVIKDEMTTFEKEKAIYEWMTTELKRDSGLLTVIPNTQADCDNPYGTLKYHNAVCVGYATTFRMFMEMLDIPCMVEHNTEKYHSWNLVQLDDEWYQVDIYSDAGSGDYSHFNITDDMSSQEFDTAFFPPAEGVKYNMAFINREEVKNIYKIPKLVRKHLDKKENYYGLFFPGDFTEQEAEIVQSIMDSIELKMNNTDEYESAGFFCRFHKLEDGYLYAVNYYNYEDNDEEEDSRLDEKTREKINTAIKKAFDGILMGDGDIDMDFDED